mgnify:CR=1 FL=1
MPNVALTGIFGSGATITASGNSVLSIPRVNLPVLTSSDTDANGQEVVFALLERLTSASGITALSSGNITAVSTTNLASASTLAKTYTFSLTLGNIPYSGIDVV